MQKTEVQKELEKFRDYVIEASKKNLVRLKKSDGKLYKSLKGKVKTMPNSISIEFMMEDYGIYQDAGVNGMSQYRKSPYKFRKGVPSKEMISSLNDWIKRKGIRPRNKKGQFKSRNGLAFGIARSIFKKGLKRSLFFTKPFEAAYKRLPEELVEKYGLDALKLFNQQVDQIIKQNG
jgi:hypothetical protein